MKIDLIELIGEHEAKVALTNKIASLNEKMIEIVNSSDFDDVDEEGEATTKRGKRAKKKILDIAKEIKKCRIAYAQLNRKK